MQRNAKASNFAALALYTCFTIWLGVIVAGVGTFLYDPTAFTAKNIASFLSNFEGRIWLVYLLLSALRGFSLLPSTPLVVAGTLLLPHQPFAVLAVSMCGIFVSSTLIYFFSEYMGFHDYFESHKPEMSHKIKRRLERPFGVLFVGLWAFFPLVPTDLVCYVAGTTMMSYRKFITAVLAGELCLCIFYVYFGGALFSYLR